MIPHQVCKRIKAARKAAGLTQVELAHKAKLNQSDIFNYETRLIPPLVKLERIAKAMKVEVNDLLNSDGKKRR